MSRIVFSRDDGHIQRTGILDHFHGISVTSISCYYRISQFIIACRDCRACFTSRFRRVLSVRACRCRYAGRFELASYARFGVRDTSSDDDDAIPLSPTVTLWLYSEL